MTQLLPSSSPLLAAQIVSARFHAGVTALGHRWELSDESDKKIGRTRPRFEGLAGKFAGRQGAVLGLTTAGPRLLDVLDANGGHVAITRRSKKPGLTLTVCAPDGTVIGTAEHMPDVAIRFADAAGRPLGEMSVRADAGDPDRSFVLCDTAGRHVATLDHGRHGPETGLALGVAGALAGANTNETRHYGFRSSSQYTVTLHAETAPTAPPLSTLAVLLPVIAGHLC